MIRAVCGGDGIGCTKIGKGSKIMATVDDQSRPLAAITTSANPHEISVLQEVLDDLPEGLKLDRLVGDCAYDSDKHDETLKKTVSSQNKF